MAIHIYMVTIVLVNWAKMDNIMLFKQSRYVSNNCNTNIIHNLYVFTL